MAKKANDRKKVVLFIVEGNSDRIALKKIFQKIYNKKMIAFEVMRLLKGILPVRL